MPEFPTSELAQRMVRNYLNDDFTLWIIEGNLRVGKSSYAIKSGFQVLDYFWGDPEEWHSIQPFMGWHPAENVEKWCNITKRQPFFIWDDAGYWLFSLNWGDPLMVEIQKYMNVVATDYNNIVMTTPSRKWILSKIANFPEMHHIKIVKADGALYGEGINNVADSPSRLNMRWAIAYQKWVSPDGKSHGVYKRFYDKYNKLMPDHVYKIYQPIREEYAMMAKMEIKKQLKLRSTIGRVNTLRLESKLRRLEDEEKELTANLRKMINDDDMGDQIVL